MIRRKKLQLGIVALVLVLSNNVQSEATCSHGCEMPRGTQKLNYKEHTTYGYEFSSKLNLVLPNAQDAMGTTQVSTTVYLTPQTGCTFVLQLRNFKIIGANAKTYENIVGIEKPVAFQYLDGAIGEDVCAEADDSSQSLNVKRAIISFFQLDSYGRQTDVFGVCPTKSEVEEDKGDVVVRRLRDLNSCDKRESLEQNFMAETLRDKKILESVPILNSNFASVQRLTGGVLKHAHILEKYTYLASGSPMNNGVNASVLSILQYIGTVEDMKPNLRSTQTKSIIFDRIPTALHKSPTNTTMEILQEFGAGGLGLTNTTAHNFLNLVKVMRESTKEDLISLYKLIQNSYFRKIFLDALLRCGTSEALMTAFELKSGNELKHKEKELLYQGFSYIRYPTREVMQLAADLLSNNQLSKETYLSIGTLVQRYCEQHTCPDDVTTEITKNFVTKLSTSDTIEMMFALKALSNAKHLPEHIAHLVLAFAQNPDKNIRARSAAFDVLTNVACMSELHNGLLDVLQTTEEDSEMRIKSFLVLAKCPDRRVAETIEFIVNNEPSIQVGGFIASHVKSLRNILSTIDIKKSFPQNSRKYSFTSEAPFNFAGFTGTTKADVIYSQKSFLPRVAKVNVTAELFGSNVNVLELELRQQNLDRLFEQLMGPVGAFKREVAGWHPPPHDFALDLDVGVKLFGSDFLYSSLTEEPRTFLDAWRWSKEFVQSKVDFEFGKPNSVVFVDSQLSYPTSMGFPLRLSVEGVSSVQVHLNCDHDSFYNRDELSPSVDLDMSVGIALDAVVVESGVKVVSKVHIATGAVLDMLRDELKVSMPLKQQEASVSHQIFYSQREYGEIEILKPVRFPMNEVVTECLEGFSEYTGLDLCLELNAPPPNNNEYLAGNYKVALVLNNTDFSHVSLAARSIVEKKMTQLSAKIVGLRQNTKIGAVVEVSTEEGFMARGTAILPKQNASAEIKYTNTRRELSVFGDLLLDKKRFFAKVGLGIARTSHKEMYSPLVYLAVPGKLDKQDYLVNTKGSVIVYHKYSDFKVNLEDLQLIVQVSPKASIYSARGFFSRNKDGYSLDLTVSNGRTEIQYNNKLRLLNNKVLFFAHLTNNQYPELNIHVSYEGANKGAQLSSKLDVVHGADYQSETNHLTITNEVDRNQDGRIEGLHNKLTYPAGDVYALLDFEHTNKSVTFDAEFKAAKCVYGAKLNSTYEGSALENYKFNLTLYGLEQRIEATVTHLHRDGEDRVHFAMILPQTPFSREPTEYTKVNALLETTGLDELYSLVINDTSHKYFEYNHTRTKGVEGTYNLLFSLGNCHIGGHAQNNNTVTVGNLLVEMVDGLNLKFDFLGNFASEMYVEAALHPYLLRWPSYKYAFKTRTGDGGQGMYSRNSLAAVHIGGDPSNNAELRLEVEETGFNYKELSAAVTHNDKFEYNFRIRQIMNPEMDKLIVNFYPHREAEGVTLEGNFFTSQGIASYAVKLDALDHQEKYLVNVTLRDYEIAVNTEVATQLFDQLQANFKLKVNNQNYLKAQVEAWGIINKLKHKLSGDLNLLDGKGNVTVQYANDDSRPITLKANYTLTKTLAIHLSLQDRSAQVLLVDATVSGTRTEYTLLANGVFLDSPFWVRASTQTDNYDTSLEIKAKDEPVAMARVLIDPYKSVIHVELKLIHSDDTEHILLKLNDEGQGVVMIKLDFLEFFTETKWTEEYPGVLTLHCTLEVADIKLRLGNSPKILQGVFTQTIYYDISLRDVNIILGSTNVTTINRVEYNINSKLSVMTSSRLMVFEEQFNKTGRLTTLNLNFYPNKLESVHKTSLNLICDHPAHNKLKLEAKLIDPNLPRDLAVLYAIHDDLQEVNQYVVLDVFKRHEDNVALFYQTAKKSYLQSEAFEIKSKGLEFLCRCSRTIAINKNPDVYFEYVYDTNIHMGKKKYFNEFMMRSTTNQMVLNLTAFNNQVFTMSALRSGVPLKSIITTELDMIGVAPMQARLIHNKFASLNFTAGFKSNMATNNTFQFLAKVFGGEVASVRATKNNSVLSSTSLSVKGNRLHFDYRYNASRVLSSLLDPARKVLSQSSAAFKVFVSQITIFEEAYEVNYRIRDATPSYTKFLEFYLKDKEKLKEELANHTALRALNLQFASIIDFIYKSTSYVTRDFYNYISWFVTSYLIRDAQVINQNAILTELLNNATYEALVELNENLGRCEKEVREFGEDFFRNFDEALALVNVIKVSLTEAFRNFKDTEVFMKLSNRLDKGPPASPELIRYYNRVMDKIRANTDSVEMMKLIDVLRDYTVKKLKKEYVDDETAVKEISTAFEDVLIHIYNDDESYSGKALYALMELWMIQLHMSYEIKYLIQIEPDQAKMIAIEEVKKLILPQDFTGIIAQNHIFTFDGSQVTVNSNCTMVLVEDVLDRNFSLTATYHNSIDSLTFTDKQYRVIIRADGTANSYRQDFNSHESINMTKGDDYILIESVYGVQLRCSLDLNTCVVKVSGYYHAHLKGLLGYANHETYDDFTLPSGKITSDTADFVRSYISGRCDQVEVATHVMSNPYCTQLFSEPTFRLCSKFIDTKPFKAACDEGLHMHITRSEDYVSHAYAASCYNRGVNIKLNDLDINTNFISY